MLLGGGGGRGKGEHTPSCWEGEVGVGRESTHQDLSVTEEPERQRVYRLYPDIAQDMST